MVYYLGTDGCAPLTPPWRKEAPSFHVTEIDAAELPGIRRQLPRRNVVYIGSREGCGCGFRSRKGDYIEQDAEDDEGTRADHAAFAEYIRGLPPSARPIQVFGCWSGDEGEPIDHFRDFSVVDLVDSNFAFRERELLTLKNEN